MKVGAIIPCRLSSSRLPKKVLMPIAEKPTLQHIIDRLALVEHLDEIIIATSIGKSDDPIEIYAKAHHIKLYRGDLENVAERFLQAALLYKLDYAIRINGDNVLIDCITIDKMISQLDLFHIDFITNVPKRTFPFGMSVEIVKVSFFQKIFSELSKLQKHREHITLYLYDNEIKYRNRFKYIENTDLPKAQGIQLALDTKEDLELITYIINGLENYPNYNLEDIVNKYYEYMDR